MVIVRAAVALQDFEVVLLMEGTLPEPKTRLSRKVIQQLDAMGLAFKARHMGPWWGRPSIALDLRR